MSSRPIHSTAKSLKACNLQWMPYQDKAGSSRSKGWEFMGQLFFAPENRNESTQLHSHIKSASAEDQLKPSGLKVYDEDNLYCKLCFDEQMTKESGLLSAVYKTSTNTSTGNWLSHATLKHGSKFEKNLSPKITKWFDSATTLTSGASSQFEYNRDLTLMVCLDLQPFSIVEQKGFKLFCHRNTTFEVPCADTLAGAALMDVYSSTKERLIKTLQECHGGCLLMDGWTDKYTATPYFAIRISVVVDWKFKVFTLKVEPVESHTSLSLSRFVKDTVFEFISKESPDKRFLLFNTTDGAANMLLLSKMLGHERITCIAHSLHLLLTVDSMHKEAEINSVLQRCKNIITTLHFKGYLLKDEILNARETVLMDKIEKMQEVLMADEDQPVVNPDEVSGVDADVNGQGVSIVDLQSRAHTHHTLKSSVPTRWNSSLDMVESVLDLWDPMNAVLKKMGKTDMCLDSEDKILLKELKAFMTPFKQLTLLVSEANPNLSAIPLIRRKISLACDKLVSDSAAMKRVKANVLANIEKRIPVGDLVKICVALDPSVRDIILTQDQVRLILEDKYNNLKNSVFSYIFQEESKSSNRTSDLDEAGPSVVAQESEEKILPLSPKRLRLALIKEMSKMEGLDERNPIELEITKYISMNTEEPALEFWKKNCKELPLLATLARIFLSLSPGSVPVECLFSTTGLILNGKRSRLSPFRVNMISCIHDNFDNLS